MEPRHRPRRGRCRDRDGGGRGARGGGSDGGGLGAEKFRQAHPEQLHDRDPNDE